MENKGSVIRELLIFANSHCLLTQEPTIPVIPNEPRTLMPLRFATGQRLKYEPLVHIRATWFKYEPFGLSDGV